MQKSAFLDTFEETLKAIGQENSHLRKVIEANGFIPTFAMGKECAWSRSYQPGERIDIRMASVRSKVQTEITVYTGFQITRRYKGNEIWDLLGDTAITEKTA